MRRALAFSIVLGMCATFAAFACGSSDEDNTANTGTGQGFFTGKVSTSLNETCSECHKTGKNGAPVFLGPNADASYTAILGFPGLISLPSRSPILQKGPHSGPALTDTQQKLVTEWLLLEVKERKLGVDPGAPQNLRAAFKAFGQCMDYEKWKAAKLYMIPLTDTENNQGQCRSCHNSGMASLWLSGGDEKDEEANALTFAKMRQFPFVQRLVVGRVKERSAGVTDGIDTQAGTFDGIEPSRRMIDKGTESQQLQANSHPRFSLSSDLTAALTTYVEETIANMNANRCQNISVPDAGLLPTDAGLGL